MLCRSFATAAPKTRDPARPVIPLSAYFRYAEAYRKENNLKGGVETMKKIGAAWKSLPEEKKKPFATAYDADKTKYKIEFEKYKNSGALDAWKRDPHKPKIPQTAYLRFLSEFRNSDKGKSLKGVAAVAKEGAIAWKTCDPAKKAKLEADYARDKETYKKALQAYKDSGKETLWKKKVGIFDYEEKIAEKKRLAAEKENQRKAKEKERKLKMKEKAKLAKEKEGKKKALERAKTAKEKQKEKAMMQKAGDKAKELRQKQKERENKALKSVKKTGLKDSEKKGAAAVAAKKAAKLDSSLALLKLEKEKIKLLVAQEKLKQQLKLAKSGTKK